jgi:5-deoxy-glucuronate isomerase
MKYFAKVKNDAKVNDLEHNPCKLLGFQLVKLAAGEKVDLDSGDREVLAVIISGKATFDLGGACFESVGGRPNPFMGKPYSVYIPAGTKYAIRAEGPVEVALASAPAAADGLEPYVIGPESVTSGVWGAANFKRNFHQILTLAGQPNLPAARLIVGETFTPSGNWSTYPPHKHEVEDLPREAYHEEMYFFKVSPAGGFGLCHYYNDQGEEENFTIRDNTIMMAPSGFHTVVSAPGYTTYYLWFLAGDHRIQATSDDPELGWVSKTVTMLRDLGH